MSELVEKSLVSVPGHSGFPNPITRTIDKRQILSKSWHLWSQMYSQLILELSKIFYSLLPPKNAEWLVWGCVSVIAALVSQCHRWAECCSLSLWDNNLVPGVLQHYHLHQPDIAATTNSTIVEFLGSPTPLRVWKICSSTLNNYHVLRPPPPSLCSRCVPLILRYFCEPNPHFLNIFILWQICGDYSTCTSLVSPPNANSKIMS